MISPSFYEDDLSTLSKLRLDNQKSKQRLRDEIDDNNTNTNTMDFILRDSPTKAKYPSPLRKSYVPSSISSGSSPIQGYNIDSKILNKENRDVFTNKDEYVRNSEINKLKREKILKSLKSPEFVRDDRLKKDTDVLLDFDTFHRGKLSGNTPDLKPYRDVKRPFSSPENTKEFIRKDRDFSKLLSKYNLKEDTDDNENQKSPVKAKIRELQNKISILEANLNKYKQKSETQTKLYNEQKSKNIELSKEVNQLNEYIDFIEYNFDKVYKRMSRLKRENQELNRVNNELGKLNDKYREKLKNKSTLDVTDTIHNFKTIFEKEDTNTFQLLNSNYR